MKDEPPCGDNNNYNELLQAEELLRKVSNLQNLKILAISLRHLLEDHVILKWCLKEKNYLLSIMY